MARARLIKPSFFKNEVLAQCKHQTRLVFIGLWTLADREGRLEDRPLRIRAELCPYENIDMDACLNELQEHGFIIRFVAGEGKNNKYIQVLNFDKHQSPHVKESASTIPAPDKHQTSTEQAPLVTLTLNPIPKDKDMGQQTGPSADETPEAPVPPQPLVADFKRLRELYPKRDGSHRWADAEKHYRARLREGATALEIEDGVLRYARYCHARGLTGTAMVQQAATFLGTNRGYAESWEVQRKPVLVRDASMGEVLR